MWWNTFFVVAGLTYLRRIGHAPEIYSQTSRICPNNLFLSPHANGSFKKLVCENIFSKYWNLRCTETIANKIGNTIQNYSQTSRICPNDLFLSPHANGSFKKLVCENIFSKYWNLRCTETIANKIGNTILFAMILFLQKNGDMGDQSFTSLDVICWLALFFERCQRVHQRFPLVHLRTECVNGVRGSLWCHVCHRIECVCCFCQCITPDIVKKLIGGVCIYARIKRKQNGKKLIVLSCMLTETCVSSFRKLNILWICYYWGHPSQASHSSASAYSASSIRGVWMDSPALRQMRLAMRQLDAEKLCGCDEWMFHYTWHFEVLFWNFPTTKKTCRNYNWVIICLILCRSTRTNSECVLFEKNTTS